MSLLEISALTLEIGNTPILRGVDLTVEAGEIVGLIGESGSGKSMTALAIMQLLPARARQGGSISYRGMELIGRDERELCHYRGSTWAMVFQEPMTALNPLMTIGAQVGEAVHVHGGFTRAEALDYAGGVLDRVGLPADRIGRDRYPHELSGGQRQRVGIAIAIAMKPALLIADEPTTALDVTTQAQILELLERLVDEDGMGMVLITHDLAVVAGVADRVAIMRQGVVVEAGETATVFRERAHPYTRMLFDASRHVPRQSARVVAPDAPPLLDVKNVVRDYPLSRKLPFAPRAAFRAVDGVSFAIGRGESVGLVGESGSGKSTLARAVLGLEPVQGGSITLDGAAVATDAPHAVRRRMQAVFQDPYGSFDPRHRVGRLVAEPLHLAPDLQSNREKLVAEALESVGLAAADAEKYIHEFSGGQRQRIAIARALIIRPSLIVLDEAVSALDVSIRAQILDLLADLRDRLGLSYLFISHDLHVVRAITERVLVMQAGRVVEQGATEAIFRAPSHAYTQQLLAATPDLDRALAARGAATD